MAFAPRVGNTATCHALVYLSVQEVNKGVRHIYHNPENIWADDHFKAEFGEDNLEWPGEFRHPQ